MSRLILCKECGEEKELDQFAPSHVNGQTGRCRQCNTRICKEKRHRLNPSARSKIPQDITCSICGQVKPSTEFRWNSKIGYKTECLECEKTKLRCVECKEVKPHDAFPRASTMSTGRHGICIECHSARSITRYREDPEYRKRHNEYGKAKSKSESGKKWRRQYYSDPEVQRHRRKYNQEYFRFLYHTDPLRRLKVKARSAVYSALKKGKLIRPDSCQSNGKYGVSCCDSTLEAHHHKGYYPRQLWLEVEWLCQSCHEEADIQAKQQPFVLCPNDSEDKAVQKVRRRADRAIRMLGLKDDEALYRATLECKGIDECDVFLNVISWLRKNGYRVKKAA